MLKKKVDNNGNEIIISIRDIGKGNNPEIFPQLFVKFATKSFILE